MPAGGETPSSSQSLREPSELMLGLRWRTEEAEAEAGFGLEEEEEFFFLVSDSAVTVVDGTAPPPPEEVVAVEGVPRETRLLLWPPRGMLQKIL